MTDDDIKRLAAPHLSTPDSKTPQIRGWDDLLAFAWAVVAKYEDSHAMIRAADRRALYLPLTEAD